MSTAAQGIFSQQQPPNGMVPYPGFVAGSYRSRSLFANPERCINLYPESVEDGLGRSRIVFYGTPGIEIFSQLPTTPVQGIFSYGGKTFAVSGGIFYEIFADATWRALGAIQVDPSFKVQFDCNTNEIAIATGVAFYIYSLTSNVVLQMSDPVSRVIDVAFIDGYFVAMLTDSSQFNISGLYDGYTWDPLDYALKEGYSDPGVALVLDRRQLWIMGTQTIEVWWDSGTGTGGFPFQRIEGGFLNTGCLAPGSHQQTEDGFLWLGSSNGAPIVYKNVGYNAVRVSTHATEYAWTQYQKAGTISDAVSSYYVEEGHRFYLLHFPSANNGEGATWVYDLTTNLWTERLSWDETRALYTAYRGRYATVNFNRQLVGDWKSGVIYSQSLSLYQDELPDSSITPIRRLRAGPVIDSGLGRDVFNELLIEMQVGQNVPVSGQGSDPIAVLRVSPDGGATWSIEMPSSLGISANYTARVVWRRLGMSIGFVPELVITEPIPIAITGAYLRAAPGN